MQYYRSRDHKIDYYNNIYNIAVYIIYISNITRCIISIIHDYICMNSCSYIYTYISKLIYMMGLNFCLETVYYIYCTYIKAYS